jgi:hypothetical protein
MIHRRVLWIVASLAAVACNNGNKESPPAPAASASAAPSSAPAPSATAFQKKRERGPGHGGVDAILFRAAGDLPLSDAQKAKVADLEEGLHDRDTAPRDAMKTFASDLAVQVRGGKIDASKLQPDEASFDTAMQSMRDKQAKALTGLHDVLDAGQRKALAGAVQARAAAREAEAKALEGDAGDASARKLGRMTSDLGLDAGQQKQLAAILAKQPGEAAMRDEMKKQVDAVLAAFQADAFDAAKTLQATSKSPHEALDRQIALTAQLLPVLHPDQREKLAVSTARPPGRGGAGGGADDDDRRGGGGRGGGE